MKIAVVGAGAMGVLFGGRLAAAGEEVTMVDVVPAVLEAINNNGLVINDETGRHSAPARALKGEELEEEQDLVILFTKTLFSRSALEASGKYIGKDTSVLTLQNGLGNIETINEFVDMEQILVGVTNYASDLKVPGEIATQGGGYVRLMSADGEMRDKVSCVADVLVKAGFNAEITKDVFSAIWEKVGFNAALNSTTALCRVPVGGIGSVEQGREFVSKIANETAAVAAAYDIEVDADEIIKSVNYAFVAHSDHYTSMAQDVQRKRKTEVDYINGEIVRRGKAKGIETPYTEAVYMLLKVVEGTYGLFQ